MPPTIKEIAKYCGKSATTVSHVLRDGPHANRYSEATRRQVRQAAEELNYLPNFFAAQIQQQNRRAIMLAFGDLSDQYSAAIASAFEDAAAERGYYIFTTTLNREREQPFYRAALGASGIRALAVVSYSSRRSLPDSVLADYARQGVHIVTIGRPINNRQISQVDYDNQRGVESAIDYLAEQGAKRIWVFGGSKGEPAPSDVSSLRAKLALARCRKLKIEAHAVTTANVDQELLGEYLSERLANEPRPDAIFASMDSHALSAIQGLARSGLKPGQDVAVIGFNDEQYAALLTPSLTTVRIPMTKLGRIGANVLIDQYEGRESPGTRLILDTELMIRESGICTPAN